MAPREPNNAVEESIELWVKRLELDFLYQSKANVFSAKTQPNVKGNNIYYENQYLQTTAKIVLTRQCDPVPENRYQ